MILLTRTTISLHSSKILRCWQKCVSRKLRVKQHTQCEIVHWLEHDYVQLGCYTCAAVTHDGVIEHLEHSSYQHYHPIT